MLRVVAQIVTDIEIVAVDGELQVPLLEVDPLPRARIEDTLGREPPDMLDVDHGAAGTAEQAAAEAEAHIGFNRDLIVVGCRPAHERGGKVAAGYGFCVLGLGGAANL